MPEIHFECARCNQPLDAPQELATQFIECPNCKEVVEVPSRSEPMKPPSVPPDLVSTPGLIVTTGNEVTGRPIESYLGVARGIVVRSPNMDQRLLGGLKQLVGGNIESYATVCEESRRQAFDRMVEHAKAMSADAVVAMRYDATEFSPGVTEVLAYGTAVKLVRARRKLNNVAPS
jgi:uncharacterized protein YbjQ (UPF0145 family)/DNA-directed RNA polymerase subunit RPC12/RpoP